jgi:hypothetical protein
MLVAVRDGETLQELFQTSSSLKQKGILGYLLSVQREDGSYLNLKIFHDLKVTALPIVSDQTDVPEGRNESLQPLFYVAEANFFRSAEEEVLGYFVKIIWGCDTLVVCL